MTPAGNCVIGRFRGTVLVTMHGDLDPAASRHLGDILRDLIDDQGNLDIVVDLLDVGKISDAGDEVLAAAADRLVVRGGELRLGGTTRAAVDSLASASHTGLAQLVALPTEQAQRRSPGRRSASAATRSGIVVHPAGNGRHHQDQNGHNPGPRRTSEKR